MADTTDTIPLQLKGESQPFMVGSEQEARKVASGYPGSRVVGLAEVEA